MRIPLITLALLLNLSVVADEVYTYDFQSLPEGWTADPEWSFGSTGAEATVSAWGGPPSSNSAYLESDMQPIVLPPGTDSVRVQVEEDHSLSGYFTTGEAYASVMATAYKNGDYYIVFSASESWGFPDHQSDGFSSITFPASEGDLLTFRFMTSASAFGGSATAMFHVYSLSVTAYGPTSLSHSTWATIKAAYP